MPIPSLSARLLYQITVIICFSMFSTAGLHAHAQDYTGTAADYQRANALRSQVNNKVITAVTNWQWSSGGKHAYFRSNKRDNTHSWMIIDTESGDIQPAFDHVAVAALLRNQALEVDPTNLPFTRLIEEDDNTLLLIGNSDNQPVAVRIDGDGNATLIDSQDLPNAGGLEPHPPSSDLRSGSSQQDTSITFENAFDSTVQIFWINSAGQRQLYATLEPGQEHAQHTFATHAWLVTTDDDTPLAKFIATDWPARAIITSPVKPKNIPVKTTQTKPRSTSNTSPDGRFTARFRDHNVFLFDHTSETEQPLATDGTADNTYVGRAHWSPDSTHIVLMQTTPAAERRVHYIESSPSDQLQPRLQSYAYLKPDDKIAQSQPQLFNVDSMQQVVIDNTLFDNPWKISRLHWLPDSSRFMFLYNQRGHQAMRVIAVDATDGSVSPIVNEEPETFFNYSNKTFLRYLDDTNELIWMSERDGWNHLYLIDVTTGEVRNQITTGNWLVRDVERVDTSTRQVWFRLMGYYDDQDPYHIHHARIDFDGTNLTLLTEGDGMHTIEYSPNGQYLIDRYSRVDQPTITELRNADDGSLICEVGRDDWQPLVETGWMPPERFVAKARDSETDIWGLIYRPQHFAADKKYPIIESIYAGPHGQHVPKTFRAYHSQQALAELGFIVVQIDGMGTNWRSKRFHDYCWKNIADAGFPDRKLWIRAAAEKYPEMDATRVGIFGGSAGGQNAMRALLDHHDLYHVAVADCGCHDNRMDKIWWNEAWMGWPVDASYKASSNVEDAHLLQGKLLLTVGETDSNVDPASTMQVVDALIEADKDFDLIVFPGKGHGAGGSAYGRRRMWDFFVEHLHGTEPRQ